jgi:multimeric flavodoxin WrbA
MSNIKKALLLVGSPKGEKSTSASLGNYLLSKLRELGAEIEKAYIYRLVNREEKINELYAMVESADLIIISFPLYVDSLPAPVIKAMELLDEERARLSETKAKAFIAISNCGFPESEQIQVALDICEMFAKAAGFIWKGGIAFGGGGAIHGIPLEKRGGIIRNLTKGLELAAELLNEGKDLSVEALKLIADPLIPKGMYKTMGNLGWHFQARKFKARKRLKDQPYLA